MDLRENRAMELESGIAAFETKNFAHATKLLSPIAEEGNPDAMYRMAIIFLLTYSPESGECIRYP